MFSAPIFASQEGTRQMNRIDNKTILTPTGGFLKKGFTHTINTYTGCSFAGTVCGVFCYAQHIHWITQGRPWGIYGAKSNIREAYRQEYDRIKHPARSKPRSLKIYMSSITDPYVPQERSLGLTSQLLEEMTLRPPDVLVIQTHSILIQRDLNLIERLSEKSTVWVSITVETDMDPVPGFPPHAFPPLQRLDTLKKFKEIGIPTQVTVSPVMPLDDPSGFANVINQSADRVILDHFLIGDGSNGQRTMRTDYVSMLDKAGYSEWAKLEKLWEIKDLFHAILGTSRVFISQEGFNAV